jgi:hypothetical protein
VIAVLCVSALIKLANAYFYFGFYSGDDVEVHEMTFAALFGWDYTAWSLRSAVYPMTFLFPVQWVLVQAGILDPATLIFAGRVVVVSFSVLMLWLVYKTGHALSNHPAVGVLACGLLAASKTHTQFASTELPRTVAATFLVAAFLILLRTPSSRLRELCGGALVGVAGSLRFSELLFVGVEPLVRVLKRQWVSALVITVAGSVTAGLILGLGDAMYWGEAFASFRQIFQYTLIDSQSSRGIQPWHYYVSHLGEWTNPVVAAASLWSVWRGYSGRAGSALGTRRLALWTWTPVILLSALPHKEPRYLVPMLPFLALGAALGLQDWLRALISTHESRRLERRALLLAGALTAALLFEIGGFRFRRSEDDVRLARELAAGGVRVVAAEQAWRFGGRLYFPRDARVTDLLAESDVGRLACERSVEVIAVRTASDRSQEIASCGYEVMPGVKSGDYTVFRRHRP